MNGEAQGEAAGVRPVHSDLVAALVFFALAGVALSQMGASVPDWIFPRVLADLLLAAGVILAARGGVRLLREGGRAHPALPAGAGSGRAALNVAVFCAIMVAYAIAENGAGFWLTSFAMLFGTSVYLTTHRTVRSTLTALAAAVLACALAYVIFLLFFYVPLPPGSWW